MVRSNHKWRSVEGDVYCILSQRWVPSPSTDVVPAAAAPAESVFAIREGAVRAIADDADAAEAGAAAAVAPDPTLRSAVLMCDGATPQYALPPNTRLEVVRIDPSPSVATFQRWRRFTHAVHGEVVADRRETTADGTPTLYRVDRGDDGAVTGYMIVSEAHVRRGHKLREIGYDGAATFTKRMRRRLVTLAPSFVPPDAHTGGGGGGGAGDARRHGRRRRRLRVSADAGERWRQPLWGLLAVQAGAPRGEPSQGGLEASQGFCVAGLDCRCIDIVKLDTIVSQNLSGSRGSRRRHRGGEWRRLGDLRLARRRARGRDQRGRGTRQRRCLVQRRRHRRRGVRGRRPVHGG